MIIADLLEWPNMNAASAFDRKRLYHGHVLDIGPMDMWFEHAQRVWQRQTKTPWEAWQSKGVQETARLVQSLREELNGKEGQEALRADLEQAGWRVRVLGPMGFRVVLPNQARVLPNAYTLHRDTWYDLPQHSINLWMGLHGCEEAINTFELFPSYFHRSIPNTSGSFDARAWQEGKITDYPCARHDIVEGEPALGICTKSGHAVAFSSHHLHRTRTSVATMRLSVDVRVVFDEDHAQGPIRHD